MQCCAQSELLLCLLKSWPVANGQLLPAYFMSTTTFCSEKESVQMKSTSLTEQTYRFPDCSSSKEEECCARFKRVSRIIIQKWIHHMYIRCYHIFAQGWQVSWVASKIYNNKNRCIHLISIKSESIRVMHWNYMVTTSRPLIILGIPQKLQYVKLEYSNI